jgi:hypothetical protein
MAYPTLTLRFILLLYLSAVISPCLAQDSQYIKVHFLYGSRPLKKYKSIEPKWFGGMLGGHAGVEADSGRILNFIPSGKFHVFAKKKNPHSSFAVHEPDAFYSILGGSADSVKKTIFYIPVSASQKEIFDSISAAYLQQTPYDYALFGMRCGAATYDLLAQLDILPQYAYSKTYKKIFYPRKLRKRLFRKAATHQWRIEQTAGSSRRKWERD